MALLRTHCCFRVVSRQDFSLLLLSPLCFVSPALGGREEEKIRRHTDLSANAFELIEKREKRQGVENGRRNFLVERFSAQLVISQRVSPGTNCKQARPDAATGKVSKLLVVLRKARFLAGIWFLLCDTLTHKDTRVRKRMHALRAHAPPSHKAGTALRLCDCNTASQQGCIEGARKKHNQQIGKRALLRRFRFDERQRRKKKKGKEKKKHP